MVHIAFGCFFFPVLPSFSDAIVDVVIQRAIDISMAQLTLLNFQNISSLQPIDSLEL